MKLASGDVEPLYAFGYRLYHQGAWSKAADAFTALILYDPFQERFWRGLAASKQMDCKYKEALHAWGILALLSGHAPSAHFHAAQCLLSIDEREDAIRALKLAETTLERDPDLSTKLHHLKEALAHESAQP